MNDPSGLRISFKYFLRYMHPYRGQFVLLSAATLYIGFAVVQRILAL